jgi:hypothetical protein
MMGRPGPRTDIAVLTDRSDARLNAEDWLAFERIISRPLAPNDREAIQRIFLEYASGMYAENNVPLLSEVRSHLVDLQQKASELRSLFLFENRTPNISLALRNLLTQAYWKHPFDCARAHVSSSERNEHGVPARMLSPARGEIPVSFIHSAHSVGEFFRSITAAAEDAVVEVERQIKDPLRIGFQKGESTKRLLHNMRVWAGNAGIPCNGKRGDGQFSDLSLLVYALLRRLPEKFQPDKMLTLGTIARYLQRAPPTEK